MNLILLISSIISFFITFLILPFWIKKAHSFGLVGKDKNKINLPAVAELGGIAVLSGFILGVLIFIAIRTFYFSSNDDIIQIFSLISSVLILAFIGLIDSLLSTSLNGNKKRTGLRRRFRIFLCLFAAIPLMVINAGNSSMNLPFIGEINLGLIYSLILIPLAIVGTSTTFNFLAGFNGLETCQGIILISGLSLVAYLTGGSWLALVGLCMISSLLAFLIFNFYPAKIFPSDVMTYPVGGLIAIMAILGNFEKIALFFFIPYILEFILKSRGKLRMQSFGNPQENGTLDMPYEKIYGLEHLAIKILKKFNKNTEKNVVYLIYSFQLVVILFGFLIFRNSIFL